MCSFISVRDKLPDTPNTEIDNNYLQAKFTDGRKCSDLIIFGNKEKNSMFLGYLMFRPKGTDDGQGGILDHDDYTWHYWDMSGYRFTYDLNGPSDCDVTHWTPAPKFPS